jgi:hypothetical protein
MTRRIPSSGMTPTMSVYAKRVHGSRKFTEIIGWDRKFSTTPKEKGYLSTTISNETSINLHQQLMSSLATKYKVSTVAGTPFAELMKTLKERNIELDGPIAQAEFARVFLGPNPSRKQIDELRQILLSYKKQIKIQNELKTATEGIEKVSAHVDPSKRVSVTEKKGFWESLFGK